MQNILSFLSFPALSDQVNSLQRWPEQDQSDFMANEELQWKKSLKLADKSRKMLIINIIHSVLKSIYKSSFLCWTMYPMFI